MGTTIEKLNKLKTTKETIRTAINNKGGTLTTSDKFSDYATAIDNIQSGGNTLKALLDTTKSARYLFYGYDGTSVDDLISYGDTSACTKMTNMFNECYNLTTIPQLDTSLCDNMAAMFYGCKKLTTIPQLDTSSCTDMESMFNNCYKLAIIDITHMINYSSSSSYSFAGNCLSLTKLIIRNIDKIPYLHSSAFTNCYHFYGTQNDTYNPEGLKDGRIYVPDNKVEELKAATN